MSPDRLHGLTDGVFAIAITLLVLDLPHPHGSARLGHDLLHEWPSYAAYIVSFVSIGVMWIEHHGLMSAVERVNRRLLECTVAFLLFVSAVPWPTSVAAEYLREGGTSARAAAILYPAVLLGVALGFVGTWLYLDRHHELVAERARPALASGTRRAALGALAYVVAILVAFVSPTASFALDALVALFYAVSRSGVPALVVAADAAQLRSGTVSS